MDIAPVTRALPTTAQAECIHKLFEKAVTEHPRQTELLRGIERAIIREPDNNGPGLPEPVEPMIQQLVASLLSQGLLKKRKLRMILRET